MSYHFNTIEIGEGTLRGKRCWVVTFWKGGRSKITITMRIPKSGVFENSPGRILSREECESLAEEIAPILCNRLT